MADNYLERHREDYEERKLRWLSGHSGSKRPTRKRQIERPEDDAL